MAKVPYYVIQVYFFHSDNLIMNFKTVLHTCLLMSHFTMAKSGVSWTKSDIKTILFDQSG